MNFLSCIQQPNMETITQNRGFFERKGSFKKKMVGEMEKKVTSNEQKEEHKGLFESVYNIDF